MIEYYTVLGLQRNASINEIKQAYRIHALKVTLLNPPIGIKN